MRRSVSSRVNLVSASAASARNCSGFRALERTDATPGRSTSQASATVAGSTERSAAISSRAFSTLGPRSVSR